MTKPSDVKIKIGEDILKPMKTAVYQEKTIVVMVNHPLKVSKRIAFDLYHDSLRPNITIEKATGVVNVGEKLRIIFWRPELNSRRIDGLLFHELILMEYYSLLSDGQQCAIGIAEHQLRSNANAFKFKAKSETITDDMKLLEYLREIIDKT